MGNQEILDGPVGFCNLKSGKIIQAASLKIFSINFKQTDLKKKIIHWSCVKTLDFFCNYAFQQVKNARLVGVLHSFLGGNAL